MLPNGSKRYRTQIAGLRYQDTFVGGNPFAGWELVDDHGHPQWAMVYYGAAARDPAEVFAALRAALRAGLEAGEWCRGPALYRHGDWLYEMELDGDITGFRGCEQLVRGGNRLYRGSVVGGIVDQVDAL